ncbi:Uma2 family endonuclease [Gloeobacter kilaueensis]|uniref:Uma2 family endonuclease n=1 Tax=Gloeobacter kilaueensis TaxID=1416614 RepID=UPI001FDFC5DB|nr:Uma2 family endonuclease [Gloeobacter kilaueensis]
MRSIRNDRSVPRLKFRPGEILLMSPLPKHGRDAHLIAGIVTALLDSDGRNYEAFTPITLERADVGGIEPDYSFYIDRWQAVAGKERLQPPTDPWPDLVVEVDVTLYSDVNDYLPYRIPEVWLCRQGRLLIYLLVGEAYQLQPTSRFFAAVDVGLLFESCLQAADSLGMGAALQQLRSRLRQNRAP